MVTAATPSLRSAIWEKSEGDMSTTRGGPAASRSSTVQSVLAPVASFTTRSSVPKGSHGLAQSPGGAAAYQVASPDADWVSAGAGGAVVVVVVAGGAVVVVGGGAVVVVVVAGGAVVVVVAGGAVVVVVVATGDEKRTSDQPVVGPAGRPRPAATLRVAGVWPVTREACAGPLNKRRGTNSSAPLKSTANSARLPPMLSVLRAPPFSGTRTRVGQRPARGGCGRR